MHWRVGTVAAVEQSWGRAVQYAVDLDSPDQAPGPRVRALGYADLVGVLGAGDRVLLTTSALERGLGTGGLAFVVAAPDRLPPDPPAGPGHIVKARYTPQQQIVLAVDEQRDRSGPRVRADACVGDQRRPGSIGRLPEDLDTRCGRTQLGRLQSLAADEQLHLGPRMADPPRRRIALRDYRSGPLDRDDRNGDDGGADRQQQRKK